MARICVAINTGSAIPRIVFASHVDAELIHLPGLRWTDKAAPKTVAVVVLDARNR
jgi:hypothetical protein